MSEATIIFRNKRYNIENKRWELDKFNTSTVETSILDFNNEKEIDEFLSAKIRVQPAVELSLTDEQKRKVVDCWNSGKINLKDIAEAVFGPGFDGRSKEFKAVKVYLTEKGLAAKASHKYEKKSDLFNLSEDHKEYIRNNAITMKPLEIAKFLFRQDITSLDIETRAITDFYKTLDPALRYSDEDELNELEGKSYRPAKTYEQAINKIFKYRITQEKLDKEKVKVQKQLDALIRYLHTYRFIYLMDNYEKLTDKKLFESSFIGYTYDKIDLTAEDLDLYMNVCMDKINLARVEKEIVELAEFKQRAIEEDGKLPMAIVEQLTSSRAERDNVSSRIKTILNGLNTQRSKRVDNNKNNVSILDLVELWKNEDERKAIIKMAEVRAKKLEDETDRLITIDDLKFQLWGMGKDEANSSI